MMGEDPSCVFPARLSSSQASRGEEVLAPQTPISKQSHSQRSTFNSEQ